MRAPRFSSGAFQSQPILTGRRKGETPEARRRRIVEFNKQQDENGALLLLPAYVLSATLTVSNSVVLEKLLKP